MMILIRENYSEDLYSPKMISRKIKLIKEEDLKQNL